MEVTHCYDLVAKKPFYNQVTRGWEGWQGVSETGTPHVQQNKATAPPTASPGDLWSYAARGHEWDLYKYYSVHLEFPHMGSNHYAHLTISIDFQNKVPGHRPSGIPRSAFLQGPWAPQSLCTSSMWSGHGAGDRLHFPFPLFCLPSSLAIQCTPHAWSKW